MHLILGLCGSPSFSVVIILTSKRCLGTNSAGNEIKKVGFILWCFALFQRLLQPGPDHVGHELNRLIEVNRKLTKHRQRGTARERRAMMWLSGSNSAS